MGPDRINPRQLGALLLERYDTLNPHTVRLADLRKWVLDLEDFDGNPADLDDRLLESVREAWYQEWKREFGS